MLVLPSLALMGQLFIPVGAGPRLPDLFNSLVASIERDMRPPRLANPCAEVRYKPWRAALATPAPQNPPTRPPPHHATQIQRNSPPNLSQDLRRLHCSDTACLMRSAESLVPACASLLLSEPEASPEPLEQPRHSSTGSYGFFTMESTSADGHVQRMSGPIGLAHIFGPSAMGPRSAMHAPRLELSGSFIPMLEDFLSGGDGPLFETLFEPEPRQPRYQPRPPPRHPCEREPVCQRELQDHTRLDGGVECLVRHLEQLSHDCQCYVHQMTGGRLIGMPPPAPAPHPAVHVHTVPPPVDYVVEPSTVTVEIEEDDGMPPRAHCLLVFTLLFLLTFLVARSLARLLCGRRTRQVVVVQPNQAKIVAVGPMVAAEIVQVAEPATKKDRS